MDDDRPFDAGRALSQDQGKPYAERRTTSLVKELRELVVERTATEEAARLRREKFDKLDEELRKRGIDVDSLVRFGMLREIVAIYIAPTVLRLILPADVAEEVIGGQGQFEIEITRGRPSGASDDAEEISGDVVARALSDAHASAQAMISQASVRVLLKIDPEPQEGFGRIRNGRMDEKVIDSYRWLVDRFSETYLKEWSTESLHLEYRWIHSNGATPCPEDLMYDRPVDEIDLMREIAGRAALDRRARPDELDPEKDLINRMQVYARTLVEHGRYREAAALFEFSLQHRPDDPILLNNIGFCLMLEDPRAAIFHLTEAVKLRYSPLPIAIYNQICCHYVLGEPRLALRVADSSWPDGFVGDACGAIVWVLSETGEWEVLDVEDVRVEIASLAARICTEEGLGDRASRWQHARQTLLDKGDSDHERNGKASSALQGPYGQPVRSDEADKSSEDS